MIKRNINDILGTDLECHTDARGGIIDLFYNETINHVAKVNSEPNVLRGNHYHRKTTQHMLMTQGSLEYWYKPANSKESPKMVLAEVGDIISTEPLEIHGLKIGPNGNEFIVFSMGSRGGKDYETDTFRVDNIIGENSNEL